MNITEIKAKIANGGYDKDFTMLYGDAASAGTRFLEAIGEFENFSLKKTVFAFFPPPAGPRSAATTPTISTAVCWQAAWTWT